MFKNTQYVSEFTQFMQGYLGEHPEVAQGQQEGRALLWDKAIYADMVKLMNEFVGVQGLELKVKLACALSVVVPEYQKFVQRFSATEHITTVVLKNLLKGLGLKDHEFSSGFVELELPLGKNLGGFELKTLTDKVEENVDKQDTDVQKYLKNLRSKLDPEVAKAA